ncbi:mitochondrial ATPase expression-domain-containing protein [Emericellopsis atlantica]|uniref:Mitochondrial ATPase expression-domain-containing protein n=1 Tax=Emericellopsis atlantica TaxID=2614577 RepID=A0A9P7ZIX0_9HYPO|nr:mitochondrial ATPase expression-domain-containing protein [Emericellopsis atlantica]KAG9252835.1 mitochondrial ATPase expression-domain-containing protein [Emericellopsis atlantica]
MLRRRALRLSSSLCPRELSTLQARRDPHWRWSRNGAGERRRHLASIADPPSTSTLHASQFSPSPDPLLETLLTAIRKRDVAVISFAFLQWTRALGDQDDQAHDAALHSLMSMPRSTLSDILRNMDPIAHPEHDLMRGVSISQGLARNSDAARFVDDFGVRVHSRQVMEGMATILEQCRVHSITLRPEDFVVFMRCVGAGGELRMAHATFGAMFEAGLAPQRTTKTWTEFVKTRFMMEPAYYSFDRSRVLMEPRQLIRHSHVRAEEKSTVRVIDRIRMSMNALQISPWNRRRDQPDEDNRRYLRRPGATLESGGGMETDDHRSFWAHYNRSRAYPNDMDEELICACLIGFAKSSDMQAVLETVLRKEYGVRVDQSTHEISGGKELQRDDPRWPTGRLLNALVESFGTMSEIPLGMQLIDFFSRRYSIPITAEVWSNLLNWTHTTANAANQKGRVMMFGKDTQRVEAKDVGAVFDIMTSEPYNVQPSFEDLDLRIRSYINSQEVTRALQMVRQEAMDYYRKVSEDLETAMLDEIMLRDAVVNPALENGTTISKATQLRRQCEADKDYVHNRIGFLLDRIIKQASNRREHRHGAMMTVEIPNILYEFAAFFPRNLKYRTRSGHVVIHDIGGERLYKPALRHTLMTKQAAAHVHPKSTDELGQTRQIRDETTGVLHENPDFIWPMNPRMAVLHSERAPSQRSMSETGKPPPYRPEHGLSREGRQWWNSIASQLIL